MGTWIAEDFHYKRTWGSSPYPAERERESRCFVPDLKMPECFGDAASVRDDDHRRAECLADAQEAFVAYALAICDNALEDEDVPPALRLCLAELARQGRNIQQWQAEMRERQG